VLANVRVHGSEVQSMSCSRSGLLNKSKLIYKYNDIIQNYYDQLRFQLPFCKLFQVC